VKLSITVCEQADELNLKMAHIAYCENFIDFSNKPYIMDRLEEQDFLVFYLQFYSALLT